MLKKMMTFAAAVLLTALCAFGQNGTIKVLAIGNSFSVDALDQHLHAIGEADGVTIIIGNMYIGGCSLERHFNNSQTDNRDYTYYKTGADGKMTSRKGVTLAEALADEKWDVVSFQQASPLSGQYETYEPYLPELIKYVKARVPATTRLLWHQTWAYSNGATHTGFFAYERSSRKMYDAIMSASATACGKYGLQVVPCGTAVQNLRDTRYSDNVTRDGYHLNYTVGRYTASCTWYEVLTGRSVLGNSYSPVGLWDEHRDAAQKAAHAAAALPFKQTDLGLWNKETVYDEALVPEYTLPDPLKCLNGSKVRTASQWMKKRRPELLNLFETEMFGKVPGRPADLHFKELYSDPNALGGKATRKEVEIYFDAAEKFHMTLLVYTPNNAKGPVPAFAGVNFYGNKYIWNDPDIISPEKVSPYGIYSGKGDPHSDRSCWWDLNQIIDAGYALMTFYRGDLDPDFYDAFSNGVHPFFRQGQEPSPDQGATIAAWAWGLSRAVDYAESDPAIDAKKVAVIGHSRLGKTALWAAAEDTRIALAISNCSGCGGAALSRRAYGETLEVIQHSFPHWFCDNFKKYVNNEAALPFDQHELIALIAPRPVYVASATEDQWADPKGEFLSAKYASPVYKLFGYKGLEGAEMLTEPDTKVWGDVLAYHYRGGVHDVTTWDWKNYIEFADRFLKK